MPGENEKLLGSISLNPFLWLSLLLDFYKINAHAKDIFLSAVSMYLYVFEYDLNQEGCL